MPRTALPAAPPGYLPQRLALAVVSLPLPLPVFTVNSSAMPTAAAPPVSRSGINGLCRPFGGSFHIVEIVAAEECRHVGRLQLAWVARGQSAYRNRHLYEPGYEPRPASNQRRR